MEREIKVTQWEYTDYSACRYDWAMAELNRLGKEGWELAGVTQNSAGCNTFWLKRQKPVIATPHIDDCTGSD